jgi:hypothetical protein
VARARRGSGSTRWLAAATLGSLLLGVSGASADCPADAAAGFYASARKAFDEKQFERTIELLRSAYACEHNPIYLGDIARTYEEAHRPKDALLVWREYEAAVTDPRERMATRGRISALEKVVEDLDRLEREKAAAEEAKRKAEADVHPAPVREPQAQRPLPAKHVSAGGVIVAVSGGAGLAAGAALGVLALAKHSSAEAEPNVMQADALQGSARTLAQASTWCFAIGGGVAAAGLAWIGLDLLRQPRDLQTGQVSVSLGGGWVGIAGSF